MLSTCLASAAAVASDGDSKALMTRTNPYPSSPPHKVKMGHHHRSVQGPLHHVHARSTMQNALDTSVVVALPLSPHPPCLSSPLPPNPPPPALPTPHSPRVGQPPNLSCCSHAEHAAQGLGHTTMFCGDGINDIAALTAADVGLAVGATDAVIAASLSTSHGSVAGKSPSHPV